MRALSRIDSDNQYYIPPFTTRSIHIIDKRRFRRAVSAECIRQHLHRVDGVCRRPPWTIKHLARQQPGYEKAALTRLLHHPPRGTDVYVEDEAKMSLFPTLTRMWMLRGQQRKIRAPGVHPPKRQEYAATDWRTGTVVRARAEKRDAEVFGRLVEKCLTRSARRNRRVIRVTDSARIYRPETSKRVAELCQRSGASCACGTFPSTRPRVCRWSGCGMTGVITSLIIMTTKHLGA